jgi:hypothetical protein
MVPSGYAQERLPHYQPSLSSLILSLSKDSPLMRSMDSGQALSLS